MQAMTKTSFWLMMAVVLIIVVTPSCGVGKAEDTAHTFAARYWGNDVQSVECMQGSCASDKDGYVSCTVFLASAPTEPVPIECATENSGCSSGCRMATGKTRKR